MPNTPKCVSQARLQDGVGIIFSDPMFSATMDWISHGISYPVVMLYPKTHIVLSATCEITHKYYFVLVISDTPNINSILPLVYSH